MEATIRDDVYAHLQRLPIAFHDGGSPASCCRGSTADLSVIRRFLSFGLLFLIVNVATYVDGRRPAASHLHWPLGLLVAASAIPLFLVSRRFARAYIVASRRMQDEQGDVATLVEESAQGLRTIKSFGRRPHMSARFAAERAAAARHGRRQGPAARPLRRPQFDLVPNLTLAVVLVAGAVAVATGALTLGELVAFVTLQLMLIWPIESLGWIIAQRPGGDHRRRPDLRGARHRAVHRGPSGRGRGAPVGGSRGAVRFEGVGFAYPDGAAPGAARRRPRRAARRDARARRRHRLRQDDAAVAGAPALRRDRRPDHARRARHARHHARLAAPAWSASRSRSRRCSRCRVRENLTLGPARRDRRRGRARRSRSRRPTSSTTCRGAWTPASASRGCRSPAGSGSGSRWPARCSAGRGCWCSTTRSPRSTCTPRRWSRRRCPGCWRAPPRCWSCTGRRRSRWPTGSRCCATARSPRSARTPSCSRPCRPTATCCRADRSRRRRRP